MTDLNTAIAVFKGKLPFPKDRCPVCGWKYADDDYGCKPDNCSMRPQPSPRADQICIPDYEHDARLYMALAKEMMRDYVLYLIEDDDFLNHCELWDYPMDGEPYQAYQATGDEIGTAICLAYCRLKGIEVVG